MKTFEFIRPVDPAAAVATAAQAKTAQQGADVRFVAGGTTLLDLMKLNVETPARHLAGQGGLRREGPAPGELLAHGSLHFNPGFLF